MHVTTIAEDGTTHSGGGEIHAGWVLRGRAIQDVWMIPRLADRRPGIAQLPGAGNWFGTTLRLYDPNLDAWRILWSDPATNFFSQQVWPCPAATTSCRKGLTLVAGTCAGVLPTFNPTRFTGWPSIRPTRAIGERSSTFSRAASRGFRTNRIKCLVAGGKAHVEPASFLPVLAGRRSRICTADSAAVCGR